MVTKATERQNRYRKRHPRRVKAARKKWRKKNIKRERKRETEYRRRKAPHLKRRYGITLEEYEALLSHQAGGCAICGASDPQKPGQWRFCVDHDHSNGKVRGLLCVPCNTALGLFKDQTELLVAAIRYLRR